MCTLAGVAARNHSRIIIVGLLDNERAAAALAKTKLVDEADIIAFQMWTCAVITKSLRRFLMPYTSQFADGVRSALVAVLAVMSKYEVNGPYSGWRLIIPALRFLFTKAADRIGHRKPTSRITFEDLKSLGKDQFGTTSGRKLACAEGTVLMQVIKLHLGSNKHSINIEKVSITRTADAEGR